MVWVKEAGGPFVHCLRFHLVVMAKTNHSQYRGKVRLLVSIDRNIRVHNIKASCDSDVRKH
jgi:hypothetical protein